MKIILKFDDEPELPIDVLPSVVSWAQRDNNETVGVKFELTNGTYWAYKYLTKTGTKVVDIRCENYWAYKPCGEEEE